MKRTLLQILCLAIITSIATTVLATQHQPKTKTKQLNAGSVNQTEKSRTQNAITKYLKQSAAKLAETASNTEKQISLWEQRAEDWYNSELETAKTYSPPKSMSNYFRVHP